MNKFLFSFFVLTSVGSMSLKGAAPVVLSVSPTNGATQVPTTSPLVFVFDQEMDTNVFLVQSTTGLVGSFEVTAPGANVLLVPTWGTDGRSLTIEPAIQYPYATFTWTLNPAGALSFFKIRSKAGEDLATVSGTFTTGVGGGDPKLGSSTPANNAINVATNVQVTFRFDQAMDTNISFTGNSGPVMWTGEGLIPSNFKYSWSADKKNLYGDYLGGLPRNILITWALNPSGATEKLQGDNGMAVPSDTYFGQFVTGNGEPICLLSGFPPNWGFYNISKRSDFRQASMTQVVPDTNASAHVFSALVKPPLSSIGVSSASVTRPGNVIDDLQQLGSIAQYVETAASEGELNSAFPPGKYTLRFTLALLMEQVIDMSMPGDLPPVPQITNFEDAQAINPAQNFTLRWNGFAGAGANDHQSMYISDTNGNIVFQAPNLCVPRELPVTANSIVIPANTLRTNQTYNAALLYGKLFYFNTNAIPQMGGFGDLVRNTYFTMKTATGGGVVLPEAARFTSFGISPSGNPQFTFTGTVGRNYNVERAGQVTGQTWQPVGTMTIPAGGIASYEDTQNGKTFPLFYRISAR